MAEGTVSVSEFYHRLERELQGLGVRVGMRRAIGGLASGYLWELAHDDIGMFAMSFNVEGLFPWDENPMKDNGGRQVITVDDMCAVLHGQVQEWIEQKQVRRAGA
ncbi:hypothetical protein LCGC14_0622940 [marine sediment metagenome]|uniref:Uncharacterized protein n=1 Tax=marine sediment metagenome TaxID=412755 RepID=A0A0F9RNK4_9ZZZZ